MENEIKKVYTGSYMNAEFIGSVLDQNGIRFLIRNYQQESLVAGWAANVIKGEAAVYVFSEDYDKAMLLLDDINACEIDEESMNKAVKAGIDAALEFEGVIGISAGNFDGKLGDKNINLLDILK